VIWAHAILTLITAGLCIYAVAGVRRENEAQLDRIEAFLTEVVNSRPVIHYEDWSRNGNH
jgi:hypothetical protein